MGTYLNPGYGRFEEALNSRIYVDKTKMISYLNSIVDTEQKYVAVSRPRRFGKSMAANMLCAYYGKSAGKPGDLPDGRHLFERCELSAEEGWDKYLGRFNVIRVVMTDSLRSGKRVSEGLARIRKLIIRDIKRTYPKEEIYDEEDLIQTMSDIYESTGVKFVIVIDEWDAVFRERKDNDAEQRVYLDFLRDWMKNQEFVSLVYMTGILPIKKYGTHSALNMFDEYSIITPMQLAPYTGFTDDEVKELCKEYHMDFNKISDWYDGYVVSDMIPVEMREKYNLGEYEGAKLSIYSPLSVVKAVTTGYIQNYWNKTESYEALSEYIRMNLEGLKDAVVVMMEGGTVKADISSYQNDMTTFTGRDDVLALLINLGYLKYNLETKEVSIPNKEILDEFKVSTRSDEWVETFRSFKNSVKLLDAIWKGDEEMAASLMEEAHDRTSNKTYNDEAALSYGIQYALYAAQKYYTTIQELDSGKGYADIVYLPSPRYPDKPALLVELKYDKDVKTAIDQIKARNYPQVLEHYAGNVLMVGIIVNALNKCVYYNYRCTRRGVECRFQWLRVGAKGNE